MMAVLGIAASGRADALQPDSHNPAHCMAAFNYSAYWFKVGHRPDKVTAMLARGAYEMEKVKAAGRSPDEALVEAKALTKAYVEDRVTMDRLFLACGTAQDEDPRFRERFSALKARMETAQRVLQPY